MKNSFSINTIFFVLTIIGLSLIPFLGVQLNPNNEGDQLYVGYSWSGVASAVIEKEVTSPLEGVLSAVKGIKEVRSISSNSSGSIILSLKKGTDIDAVRFEVGSLMRHIYPKLPEGVSRPYVGASGSNESDQKLLMSYTINGEGSTLALQKYAEDHILPSLSLMDDVAKVNVSGARPLEWELSYDSNQLEQLKLSVSELQGAISNHLSSRELGGASFQEAQDSSYMFLSFYGQPSDSLVWNRVPVTNHQGRILYLTDLVKVKLKEQQAQSYFRINGLNSIYLSIYTGKGANQVRVGEQVRQKIKELKRNFPDSLSLLLNTDVSEDLNKETNKILYRSGLALMILLLFVLLISRQWQYLTIIALGLFANLTIAIIFFYWFSIQIHLYSLAGITVSLGIIIDNAIVTADHIRHHKNNKVFLAILAATLTTMGALSVIFFLEPHQRLNLVDFAAVMLVNLGVSLFIAFFFIPALMDKIPLPTRLGNKGVRMKRRVVLFTNIYERFIAYSYRRKWLFIIGFIWVFGLPFFLIPDKLGVRNHYRGNQQELTSFQEQYNKTLGNSTFLSDVKPWINKIFGGSLYYFSSYMAEIVYNGDTQKTQLTLNATMPEGANINQMNEIFIGLETYLASFNEIEKFVTNISSSNGSMRISFKKEFENLDFPYKLKNLLTTKAIETGGADFDIHGVGQGFSNRISEGYHSNRIEIAGYNYEELMDHARVLKEELLKHNRIKEVFVRTERNSRGKPKYEFVADVDMQLLAYNGTSIRQLYGGLQRLSHAESRAGNVPMGKDILPVVLRPIRNSDLKIWDLNNKPINGENGRASRFKKVSSISKVRANTSIQKFNQEYQVWVTYDFIGPHQLSERVMKKNIEMVSKYLPLGYSVKQGNNYSGWNYREKKQYALLFLVMVIIYFICAILLESLWQPFAVIATIPLSFVGVFITFTIFKFPFDQGAYASMILLCGLTVNSALYIINDYNNSRRNKPLGIKLRHYLKAFNHKITPVLLTVFSTALGLIPFVIAGKDEGFWFSLAVGAIGGLIFSLIAIFIALPLFMKLSVDDKQLSKNS